MSEESFIINQKTESVDISGIEIRSEDVQEIMGYIPHWIIRWGITLIFIVVGVFLTGSYFFKYPDVIMSNIVLTTRVPPASMVARVSGKIQEIFAKDNQKIKSGEAIALLESTVNYTHLCGLKSKLALLKDVPSHFDPAVAVSFDDNYSLGEIQSPFTVFTRSYRDYVHFIREDFFNKKSTALRAQAERYQTLYKKTERQTAIMEEDFKLAGEQFDRSKTLFREGVISQMEYDNARAAFYQKEYSLEGAHSSIANQKIQIAQLEQTIMDQTEQYREQKKTLEQGLNQSYENLAAAIELWEQNYLFKSPTDGLVSFTKIWSINQNVRAGDTVVTVIPEKAGEIFGKVVLPVQGSGKVKVKQRVNIKFLSYPHVDFGMVSGIVRSRSLVIQDNSYIVEVALPEGLKTNYGNNLPFNQEMTGTAEIITDDIRLLDRIFKPLKSILERK